MHDADHKHKPAEAAALVTDRRAPSRTTIDTKKHDDQRENIIYRCICTK